MRPTDFAILAGIDPARVSRLAKQCRILQNPRTRDVLTEHPLTKGFLLSRMSIIRAEMQGLCTPPPMWKLAVAIIAGRKRAIVAWPQIPDGGKFAEWFADATLDYKSSVAKIGDAIYPVTIETGEKE